MISNYKKLSQIGAIPKIHKSKKLQSQTNFRDGGGVWYFLNNVIFIINGLTYHEHHKSCDDQSFILLFHPQNHRWCNYIYLATMEWGYGYLEHFCYYNQYGHAFLKEQSIEYGVIHHIL
jgi:hypothetical protein